MKTVRTSFRLLPLLVLLAGIPAAAKSRPPLSVTSRQRIYRRIAERGNAATVGIYARRSEIERYYGTGVVISADGYVLTSTTVVPEGANEIEVYFTDHSRRLAELVEVNNDLETSLLKVQATELAYLPTATELPGIGERAYSFSNAFNMIRLGEQASFSAGIISGVYPVRSADSQSTYEGIALETDAAINPGQDGGPLLNARGQVVGIISLSYSNVRWQGMAIPITLVAKGLEAVKTGRVRLRHDPLLKPPPHDLATDNKLARIAKQLRSVVVSIKIKRKYPPEELPRLHLPHFLEKNPKVAEMEPQKRTRVLQVFAQTERVLQANRQLRRPGGPVPGVLISSRGYIVTSYFNLMPDPTVVTRRGRVRKIEYDGDLGKLMQSARIDQSRVRRTANTVQSVEVTLADGRKYKARIISENKDLRFTLLRIYRRDGQPELPYISLSRYAAEPRLGETVGVLGISPGDAPYTLNTGIVSAAKRRRGQVFQFDALINYGNSGGPIFTDEAKLVGIAAAPMNPGPIMGYVLSQQQLTRWTLAPNGGISFGIPIKQVLDALPGMAQGDDVEQDKGPFLGVAPSAGEVLADELVVGRVTPKSPAAKAGIKAKDQVLSIDGEKMTSWKQFIQAVRRRDVGDVIDITVRRPDTDKVITLNAKLEKQP